MEFLKIAYTIKEVNTDPNIADLSAIVNYTGLVLSASICGDGRFRVLVMCIEDKRVYNMCPIKNNVRILGVVHSNTEDFFLAIGER